MRFPKKDSSWKTEESKAFEKKARRAFYDESLTDVEADAIINEYNSYAKTHGGAFCDKLMTRKKARESGHRIF